MVSSRNDRNWSSFLCKCCNTSNGYRYFRKRSEFGIPTPSKFIAFVWSQMQQYNVQGLGTSSDAGTKLDFPRDGSNVAHLQSIKGVGSSLTFLTGGT